MPGTLSPLDAVTRPPAMVIEEYFLGHVRGWGIFDGRRGTLRRQVMLDLHGTNHDPRSWTNPHDFRPERFKDWKGNAFSLIPQGAGGFDEGHRCPGEWITIELMKVAVDFLARRIAYDVPEQDLRIDRARLPALPRSRFVIGNVQPCD